jgi:hypothetical protein
MLLSRRDSFQRRVPQSRRRHCLELDVSVHLSVIYAMDSDPGWVYIFLLYRACLGCLLSVGVPGSRLACVGPLTSMMGRRFCAAACDGLLDCASNVRGDHGSIVVDAWFCC